MEITSRDGNMVVDFYPVKDWDNNIIHNRILKVLSFRGDKQKKMLITRDEFYYQVRMVNTGTPSMTGSPATQMLVRDFIWS